jgi:hypothetical protein
VRYITKSHIIVGCIAKLYYVAIPEIPRVALYKTCTGDIAVF